MDQRRIRIRIIAGTAYIVVLSLIALSISETLGEAVAFAFIMLFLSGMVWFTHYINRPPPSIMKDVDAPRRRRRDR